MEGQYAIWRFDAMESLPDRLFEGPGFVSVTRTDDELSIVAREGTIREGLSCKVEPGWVLFKVDGPLSFSMLGVLSALAGPLASAGISIFVVSTYDTDYLMVREADAKRARAVLREQGYLQASHAGDQ